MIIVAKNLNFPPPPSQNPTFLGIKVNKKLSKKSCVRNKIKRRIRHLLRLIIDSNSFDLSKIAITFIPFKGFELVGFNKLLLELKIILLKLIDFK